MAKPYGVGDIILYNLYNSVEKEFYGEKRKGLIVGTRIRRRFSHNLSGKEYKVVTQGEPPLWVKHMEIKRRLSTGNKIPDRYQNPPREF